jgi:hypothetical protein
MVHVYIYTSDIPPPLLIIIIIIVVVEAVVIIIIITLSLFTPLVCPPMTSLIVELELS